MSPLAPTPSYAATQPLYHVDPYTPCLHLISRVYPLPQGLLSS